MAHQATADHAYSSFLPITHLCLASFAEPSRFRGVATMQFISMTNP
jgi:hypothetical protein